MSTKSYYKCPACGKEMVCDRRKTGKAAKHSGGYYERKVAKRMEKLTGIPFRKTPRSGGLHIPGDVTCIDTNIKLPFNIECKNYNDLTLLRVFKNPRCLLTLKWKDLENDILIFNDAGTHIVVAHWLWCVMEESNEVDKVDCFGKIELENEMFYILTLEEFCAKLIVPLKEEEE